MLSPPPRDADGVVEPHDHPEILASDLLIRGIPPEHVIPDENRGGMRISSAAVQPSSRGRYPGMSVDHERSALEAGSGPSALALRTPFAGSIAFSAGSIRALTLRPGAEPLADNPFHCEVWGPDPTPHKFTGGQKNKILAAAIWYVRIDGAKLPADPAD